MNKKIIIAAAVAVIIAIIAFFAVGGSSPKPADTFSKIQDAIEKKDIAEVEKYIDFNALASDAVDFLHGGESKEALLFVNLTEERIGLTEAFHKMAEIGKIENDEIFTPFDMKKKYYNLRTLQTRIGLYAWGKYNGIAKTHKDGDIIIASVKMQDKVMGKDFIIDVKMKEEDAVLRIKGISNLEEISAKWMDETSKTKNKVAIEAFNRKLETSFDESIRSGDEKYMPKSKIKTEYDK